MHLRESFFCFNLKIQLLQTPLLVSFPEQKLSPWSRILSQKLTGPQLVKKYTELLGFWTFSVV